MKKLSVNCRDLITNNGREYNLNLRRFMEKWVILTMKIYIQNHYNIPIYEGKSHATDF